MDAVIELGPLMFAADRLLAVALLVIFTFAVGKIGDWTGRESMTAATWSLIAGILAARIAYIVTHWSAYSQDWSSALAIWQGGFSAWAGILAAAAVLLAKLGINRTSGLSIAVTAALAVLWAGANILLAAPPRPLPELPALAALDGTPIDPESLSRRPYVINLWATWCPPCRRELPMLAQVAARSDMPILLVNQAESAGEVLGYLAEVGIPGDAVVLDEEAALMGAVGGTALPTTLFVNAKGEAAATHIGEISRAALLNEMAELEED